MGEGPAATLARGPGFAANDRVSALDYSRAMRRLSVLAVVATIALSLLPPACAEEVSARVGGAGADLRGTNLARLDLGPADFAFADLRGADLRGAVLLGARLLGADLRGAALQGADLRGADLRGADLRGARLARADLGGADLTLADLRDIDLFQEDAVTEVPAAPAAAEGRPRKSEPEKRSGAAARDCSVAGATLDRALQSRPVCVYPPTSAVDVLHGFERAGGLPLIADGTGRAPGAFIAARSALLGELACAEATGEAAFGLARRALDVDAAGVSASAAGFEVAPVIRALLDRGCAGARLFPSELRAALTRTLTD